jgi:hypothetical protein
VGTYGDRFEGEDGALRSAQGGVVKHVFQYGGYRVVGNEELVELGEYTAISSVGISNSTGDEVRTDGYGDLLVGECTDRVSLKVEETGEGDDARTDEVVDVILVGGAAGRSGLDQGAASRCCRDT